MDARHKKAMQQNRVFLVENLTVDDKFLAYFSDGDVLLENHMEDVLVKSTKAEKVGEFLRIIQRRGPKAMSRLLEALHRTGQDYVADRLDPVLSSQVRAHMGTHVNPSKPINNIQEQGGGYFNSPLGGGEMAEPNLEDGGDSFIDVKVNLVDPNNPAFGRLLTDSGVYEMKTRSRSRALIINNENFLDGVKLSDREGSNYDMTNLDSLLNQLGYDTTVKSDLTAREIVQVIDDERRHPGHLNANSFVMAIFSHGAKGSVYGCDGKAVDIEDIKGCFDGRGCKALAGKPKLFIIQACQGKQSTRGVPQADADSGDEGGEDDLTETLRRLRLGDEDTQDAVPWATVSTTMAHEKGDMLVAYSTVQGYKSWRLPTEGSWFIRTLVKIFMFYAHREHVVELLTRVRDAVGKKQTGMKSDGSGLYVQMTRNDDTLRKKWYFFPGLVQSTFS